MHFKGFSPSLTCHIETSATVPKFLSTIFSREEAEDLYMNPVWMDSFSHFISLAAVPNGGLGALKGSHSVGQCSPYLLKTIGDVPILFEEYAKVPSKKVWFTSIIIWSSLAHAGSCDIH